MVPSMGAVRIFSQIFRRIISVILGSSLERKTAALLTEPAISAIFKLNCNTKSHAFHSAGGIAFVCKVFVTDLLNVRTFVGFVVSHKVCAHSTKAIQIAKIFFFESMDILNCAGEKTFEPNATGRTFSSLAISFDRDCLDS